MADLEAWRRPKRRPVDARGRVKTPTLARPAYRYWPVLATVSMERPASWPLPVTSVRM